ncbi:MAG: hypothetical protein CME62_15775 [Halobacteriovoraceae bacterium]|nr:hypothetical protein [Halobacteriovoraceae bacterium]|tara:strand:+ start:7464 stop:8648 length:1185 start_codon:yes stop_codon:yes gene_type:complete
MHVSSRKLNSPVACPTSKSYAARILILASLVKKPFHIIDLPKAQDTKDLVAALKICGLEIEDGLVRNSFPACEQSLSEKVKLPVGEGGTTIRFLLPFLALGQKEYQLIFAEGMLKRPMKAMYQALQNSGVKVIETAEGVNIQGPLDHRAKLKIDASLSSQFASGVEMLKVAGVINTNIENLNHSQAYFEMTQYCLQVVREKNTFTIPVDMSSLAYFLCYAVLNQDLLIQNVFKSDDLQADSAIFEILRSIGAEFHFQAQGLQIKMLEKRQQAFSIDSRDCIDLVPTLIYLASYLDGTSQFTHLKHLRVKESDRLSEMINIMNLCEIKYVYNEVADEMMIHGNSKHQFQINKIDTADDHRMVMVASLYLKQNGGGEVYPGNSVRKSFPQFFEYFS